MTNHHLDSSRTQAVKNTPGKSATKSHSDTLGRQSFALQEVRCATRWNDPCKDHVLRHVGLQTNKSAYRRDLVGRDDQPAFKARVIVVYDDLQAGDSWAIGG